LSRGAKSIFVSNRSHERATALAAEMGGAAIHFDRWHEWFDDIDILIGSTAAPHAIVTVEKLSSAMRGRRNRPLFVIDLAVPRDVEPAVNELEGVYLYDVDSLRQLAEHSLELRKQDLASCEQMIGRHVEEFTAWLAGGRPVPPKPGRSRPVPPLSPHPTESSL
jgi:glutamyl-tRNA reductase